VLNSANPPCTGEVPVDRGGGKSWKQGKIRTAKWDEFRSALQE